MMQTTCLRCMSICMIRMCFHFIIMFYLFFFFNDTATTEIYTLSLHDALPIYALIFFFGRKVYKIRSKGLKLSQFRSEEHTSELQSRREISYAVFCLKKKKRKWLYSSSSRFARPLYVPFFRASFLPSFLRRLLL